jgi:hypothetical protein
MVDPKFKITVEPEIETDETVTAEPAATTAKAEVDAVVELRASLYVIVTVVPAVFTAEEE